jgi:hypothetical protein
MTTTSAAASEPREIKLHPTAREIGFSLEPVAAAPAIVGGSLRSLTPLFCLPGKATAHSSQPDHGNCKDLICCAHRPPSWCDDGAMIVTIPTPNSSIACRPGCPASSST